MMVLAFMVMTLAFHYEWMRWLFIEVVGNFSLVWLWEAFYLIFFLYEIYFIFCYFRGNCRVEFKVFRGLLNFGRNLIDLTLRLLEGNTFSTIYEIIAERAKLLNFSKSLSYIVFRGLWVTEVTRNLEEITHPLFKS